MQGVRLLATPVFYQNKKDVVQREEATEQEGKHKRNKRHEKKISKAEQNMMKAFEEIQFDVVKLRSIMQQNFLKTSKEGHEKRQELYNKRSEELRNLRDACRASNYDCDINNFWLIVLKKFYPKMITDADEQILTNLLDVRCRIVDDEGLQFELQFHFDENMYFANTILTKTYFLSYLPLRTTENDGVRVVECKGCGIAWCKPGKKLKDKGALNFFKFFTPVALPNDKRHPDYAKIEAELKEDFEIGYQMKETVIPKAFHFYNDAIFLHTDDDSDSEKADSDETALSEATEVSQFTSSDDDENQHESENSSEYESENSCEQNSQGTEEEDLEYDD